jgi:3-dehydroquinate synthase
MSSIEIKSSQGNYWVRFSSGLADLSDPNFFYIIDRSVAGNRVLEGLDTSRTLLVDGSERTKTIESCSELISRLAEMGVNRKSSLVAVGGGSVQDAVTLSASLYMRGIPWIYLPTTFMSMADSCIGGKSAINVGKFKNLVGNFYPPCEIRLEKDFLISLPSHAVASGLSEAVKIQIAKGPEHFHEFEGKLLAYNATSDPGILLDIAKMTILSKKWFIEIDEYDKKERQLLNYGHSFGHALESASGMGIPHGLAIGVGMLVANSLVDQSTYLGEVDRAIKAILNDSGFDFGMLSVDLDRFMEALKMDKKNSPENQVLILLNAHDQLEVKSLKLTSARLQEQSNILVGVLDEMRKSL